MGKRKQRERGSEAWRGFKRHGSILADIIVTQRRRSRSVRGVKRHESFLADSIVTQRRRSRSHLGRACASDGTGQCSRQSSQGAHSFRGNAYWVIAPWRRANSFLDCLLQASNVSVGFARAQFGNKKCFVSDTKDPPRQPSFDPRQHAKQP